MVAISRRTKNRLLWIVVAWFAALRLVGWFQSLGPMRWTTRLWLASALILVGVTVASATVPALDHLIPRRLRDALLFGLVGIAIGLTGAALLRGDLAAGPAEWAFLIAAIVAAAIHYTPSPADPYTSA